MGVRAGCVVYFIGPAAGEGPIKIGCSQNPAVRLECVRAWAPIPLKVLATTPGYEPLERRFQWHFRRLWSHGEWFRADGELHQAIAEVAAGTFDFSRLPEVGKRVTRTMALAG